MKKIIIIMIIIFIMVITVIFRNQQKTANYLSTPTPSPMNLQKELESIDPKVLDSDFDE